MTEPASPTYLTRRIGPADPACGFRCGKHPLDDYFRRHALPNDQGNIAWPTCWMRRLTTSPPDCRRSSGSTRSAWPPSAPPEAATPTASGHRARLLEGARAGAEDRDGDRGAGGGISRMAAHHASGRITRSWNPQLARSPMTQNPLPNGSLQNATGFGPCVRNSLSIVPPSARTFSNTASRSGT